MTFVRNTAGVLAGLALGLSIAAPASASERGSAAEAKAMAEKAVGHIKGAGKDKAFADFTAKGAGWQNKDLYVFAIDFEGMVYAHGANAALVGKNISALKDPSGKAFVVEFAEVARGKGSGWVDYQFSDPQTKKNLPKSSYILRWPDGGGYVGVGIYKQ